MWVVFVLIYGTLKGVREILKKKSMESSSVMEVLFFYTLFSFLLVCPFSHGWLEVPAPLLAGIALKSLFVFSAWILSFHALKRLPLSLYGVLDLSRVLFSTTLAFLVLHETPASQQMLGLLLVCAGLLFLKLPHKGSVKEDVSPLLVGFALTSCMLNTMSSLSDKLLMQHLTSSQLQFWYMLFMVVYYSLYIVIRKEHMRWKQAAVNPLIWLQSLVFVIGDRVLFIANADPASRMSIMTLIKQSSVIISILAGRFIFKEKNILHKLICAGIIIIGIMISVM